MKHGGAMKDPLKEPGLDQCPECDGAGEVCTRCQELPDNCDCEGETFAECPTCAGSGQLEVEEDEDDEEEEEDET